MDDEEFKYSFGGWIGGGIAALAALIFFCDALDKLAAFVAPKWHLVEKFL